MKLKNKKTGEIVDLIEIVRIDDVSNEFYLRLSDNKGRTFKVGFNSLAELNAVWEDVPEEPKEYWTIDWTCTGVTTNKYSGDDVDDFNEAIGNYFETKEEAERAVERLRAWKRLKDKGFVFKGVNEDDGSIKTGLSKGVKIWESVEFYEDMTLLFGGEE